MSVSDVRYRIAGASIAVRRWHAGAPRRVLAMHGWLDNAGSFDALAPHWPDTDLLAPDLPGHGLSDHKPPQATYNLWDDLLDLLRLCEELGWQRFHVLGHSRGAMMALLLAAALPERIISGIYLDGLLPAPTPARQCGQQLGQFLRDHLRSGRRPARGYDSPEEAFAARCRATGMERDIAERLLARNLDCRGGRYYWRNDARLAAASAFKLSAEHCQALLDDLRVPGLLLLAREGLGAALAQAAKHCAALSTATVPGGHHFHLQAGSDDAAALIRDFWHAPVVTDNSEETAP